MASGAMAVSGGSWTPQLDYVQLQDSFAHGGSGVWKRTSACILEGAMVIVEAVEVTWPTFSAVWDQMKRVNQKIYLATGWQGGWRRDLMCSCGSWWESEDGVGMRGERGEVMDTSGKCPTGLVLSYRADGNFSRSDQNQWTSRLFFFESSVFNVTYIWHNRKDQQWSICCIGYDAGAYFFLPLVRLLACELFLVHFGWLYSYSIAESLILHSYMLPLCGTCPTPPPRLQLCTVNDPSSDHSTNDHNQKELMTMCRTNSNFNNNALDHCMTMATKTAMTTTVVATFPMKMLVQGCLQRQQIPQVHNRPPTLMTTTTTTHMMTHWHHHLWQQDDDDENAHNNQRWGQLQWQAAGRTYLQ